MCLSSILGSWIQMGAKSEMSEKTSQVSADLERRIVGGTEEYLIVFGAKARCTSIGVGPVGVNQLPFTKGLSRSPIRLHRSSPSPEGAAWSCSKASPFQRTTPHVRFQGGLFRIERDPAWKGGRSCGSNEGGIVCIDTRDEGVRSAVSPNVSPRVVSTLGGSKSCRLETHWL